MVLLLNIWENFGQLLSMHPMVLLLNIGENVGQLLSMHPMVLLLNIVKILSLVCGFSAAIIFYYIEIH